MNLKLHYLYRDTGNYKNYGEVAFTDASGIPLADIETALRACMFDSNWFIADKWDLPDLHFKEFPWDSELDHDLHEFEKLEETNETVSSQEDIAEFLQMAKEKPLRNN